MKKRQNKNNISENSNSDELTSSSVMRKKDIHYCTVNKYKAIFIDHNFERKIQKWQVSYCMTDCVTWKSGLSKFCQNGIFI